VESLLALNFTGYYWPEMNCWKPSLYIKLRYEALSQWLLLNRDMNLSLNGCADFSNTN
jgi:hypothetical protein